MLNWLKQFSTFCFLDSNQYNNDNEMLIGAGVVRRYASSAGDALEGLQRFIDEQRSWLFGHLGYELTTSEKVSHTAKEDLLLFPDLFFFEPEIVLSVKAGIVEIIAGDPEAVFQAVHQQISGQNKTEPGAVTVENRIGRDEYITIINQLKSHIQRGDCYEINFCQEFFAKNIEADPFLLFEKLNHISPNPFSGLYRVEDKWLLCASPERFIKKQGPAIISQPIKGTLKRNLFADGNLMEERSSLLQSEKDKAENVMIVDLVRNDLSRICKEGSVKVDELFGIYSFPQVHQMISTVSGILKDNTGFAAIIDATFPMGSMTGAPKLSVMNLVDRYEKSRRGIFSGALGYMAPDANFDFNVVIRSLMYNQSTKYLSFQAGGGITVYSDAEKEWEECMLKAKAIKEILGS
ncbi:MAG: anthranilate synthase component I family protein [Niabella sp.]